jgi:hypothetical protein
LDWESEAADIQWSIEQGKKKKRPPTADQLLKLKLEPVCDPGTLIMVGAYAEMSTCRPGGFGAMPIPITVIWEWCDRHQLDEDATAHMTHVLRVVDGEIIRRERARDRTNDKGKGKKR